MAFLWFDSWAPGNAGDCISIGIFCGEHSPRLIGNNCSLALSKYIYKFGSKYNERRVPAVDISVVVAQGPYAGGIRSCPRFTGHNLPENREIWGPGHLWAEGALGVELRRGLRYIASRRL